MHDVTIIDLNTYNVIDNLYMTCCVYYVVPVTCKQSVEQIYFQHFSLINEFYNSYYSMWEVLP